MVGGRYNFSAIEEKWQKFWEEKQVFKSSVDATKEKVYVLEMLPYPSGRIHMGHVRNYTLGDIYARYKRAKGYNVLHPMGWDAFGLPAENAAIQHNMQPSKWTYENIDFMRKQIKSMGMSYDWEREIATCHPQYYKHEQEMFLKFLENNLAYRKKAWVNWDPIENTVLANEQVVDGKGWRSGAVVEKRELNQWFLRTTKFSEELLQGIDTLTKWPDKVKTMQYNWIGKSEGVTFEFKISGRQDKIKVFTTRADTLYGASFCAISPNHSLSLELAEKDPKLKAFIEECNKTSTSEEAIEKAEKIGYDSGLRVKHIFDENIELPIYIANFILIDYGTGAVFGCPAHDQRDLDFARKYNLSVKAVVKPRDYKLDDFDVQNEAYSGEGIHFNSPFAGLSITEAKAKALDLIEELKVGERQINYRFHDWGVSRQRYWGCPIPVVHCESCGVVPVPSSELPVTLPEDVSFKETGNPLSNHPTWKHVNCPKCGEKAQRECDTFDTFFESSWYFLRYISPRLTEQGVDISEADYWMNVDIYIGGIEHAVLHLLYARFFVKALGYCGYINPDLIEPFNGLLTQGMICHETYKDEDGNWLYPKDVIKQNDTFISALTNKKVTIGRVEKMSKSKKNVVEPDEIIKNYGADTARMFVVSDSPPDRDLEWSDTGADGVWRYLSRLWQLVVDNSQIIKKYSAVATEDLNDNLQKIYGSIHKANKGVQEDIEGFHYNKAIAKIRELTNTLSVMKLDDELNQQVFSYGIKLVLVMLNPICPHITEELWHNGLENMVSLAESKWLEVDDNWLVDSKITLALQVNGKLRNTIDIPVDLDKKTIEELALKDKKISNFIKELTIRKIIVVPNKIVNIVAK